MVGESGCGKSVTASSIMQLLPKLSRIESGAITYHSEKGDIRIDQLPRNGKEMRALRGRDIAMIFQDPMTALNPIDPIGRQIAEVIALHSKVSKAEAAVRAAKVLEMVGIPAERSSDYPHQFSGGMKQRLGIAQAVINDPQVLVLDEPTAGLDPKERVRFRNLISALAQDKVVILSTHIVSDVEYIADEILIMRAGQIVATGTVEEILAQVSGVVWECAVTPREADAMSARMAVGNVRYDHNGMAVVRIVSDVPPHESGRLVEPTLEDVYLYIFQEGSEDASGDFARPRSHTNPRSARRGGRRG